MQRTWILVALSSWTGFACLLAGCTPNSTAPAAKPAASPTAATHDHSGWWCAEHGIPEEECSLCSATAAAKFKERGDWCAKHQRAESQCFLCDPQRAEKYVKLYVAKFGKQPPALPQ